MTIQTTLFPVAPLPKKQRRKISDEEKKRREAREHAHMLFKRHKAGFTDFTDSEIRIINNYMKNFS